MSKVKAAWGQVEIVPNIGNMRNRDGEHWETPEQPIAGLRQVYGGVGAVRAVCCAWCGSSRWVPAHWHWHSTGLAAKQEQ